MVIPSHDKFNVLFKRAMGPKEQDFGDVTQIQVGDTVSYWDAFKSRASGRVEKVNSRAQRLRVASHKYGNHILRPGRTLEFPEVLEVLRPKDAPELIEAVEDEEPIEKDVPEEAPAQEEDGEAPKKEHRRKASPSGPVQSRKVPIR